MKLPLLGRRPPATTPGDDDPLQAATNTTTSTTPLLLASGSESSGLRCRRGPAAASAGPAATAAMNASSPSPPPPDASNPDDANSPRPQSRGGLSASPPPRLRPPPPPTPPPAALYWQHSRPLRARAVADDGTRLYYEVHGLTSRAHRALQRRAGDVPRPACWSAAGFFSESSGGGAGTDDEQQQQGGASWRPSSPRLAEDREQHDDAKVVAETATAEAASASDDDRDADPRPRVLLIMGLACGASAWRWTIPDLVAPLSSHSQQQHHHHHQPPCSSSAAAPVAPMVVAALDNRGCGSSDAPRDKARYSTEIMAADARRVLEDLGWWRRRGRRGAGATGAGGEGAGGGDQAPSSPPPPAAARPVHIVGFSMGGMIALKLAASVALDPDPMRHAVASLTVLSASGGGVETIPWRSLQGLRTAACIALARSPEAAAEATLGMHFARRTLRAPVSPHHHHDHHPEAAEDDDGGGKVSPPVAGAAAPPPPPPSQQQQQPPPQPLRRFELLRREYLVRSSSSQPAHGFGGQLRACWRHSFSEQEARAVRRSHFPTLVLHGRRDLLADPSLGEKLARRLRCPCVFLEGAHFIVRECAAQTNALLVAVALSDHVSGGGGSSSDVAGIDGRAVAAMSAAAAAMSAGLPRFARAPREAQATWHLEPSPVVRALWSGRVAAPPRQQQQQQEEDGGGGKVAAAGGGGGEGVTAPRVTVRAL
jgi:pimeloyl-ACP methyl ester carboxylesterase